MSTNSKIEWTETTWNPTTGCDRVSAGCDNCYALTMSKRLKAMGQARYQLDGDPRTSGPGFGLTLHEDALGEPLRWRKPRRVFVNSMSDLFHDRVPVEFLAEVFAVMARTPQHTYQILTKRHARLRSVLKSPVFKAHFARLTDGTAAADAILPLPNVWLGVSAEDQHWADIRIPALLDTPATVRWVSAEPLLGPITLRAEWTGSDPHRRHEPSVDWIVIGGESGPSARPMDPEWARDIVEQARNGGTVPFVKQLGAVWARENGADSKGGNWWHWPADLCVRGYPGGAS